MSVSWPDGLVEEISARRVVLFMGSGISKNSVGKDGKTRPKNWAEFLEAGATKVGKKNSKLVKEVKKLIGRSDFLTACEVIKNKLGRQTFSTFLISEFQSPGFKAAQFFGVSTFELL